MKSQEEMRYVKSKKQMRRPVLCAYQQPYSNHDYQDYAMAWFQQFLDQFLSLKPIERVCNSN